MNRSEISIIAAPSITAAASFFCCFLERGELDLFRSYLNAFRRGAEEPSAIGHQ
jgi:hypothetical protein